MMATTVVNVQQDKGDVYIGRSRQGEPPTKWHNPWWLRPDAIHLERLNNALQYAVYLYTKDELLSQVHVLRGKKLACFCSPRVCHGHVLKEVADSDDPRATLIDVIGRLAVKIQEEAAKEILAIAPKLEFVEV
jgi:hypothetical protein